MRITPPWVYFTLLDSTLLYNHSTSLYLTQRYHTLALYSSLYFTLLNSTFLHNGCTSLYGTLPWLNLTLRYQKIALLQSTLAYITLLWLYLTLLYSTLFYHSSTSFYVSLLHSKLLYHGSTSLPCSILSLLTPSHCLLVFPLSHGPIYGKLNF